MLQNPASDSKALKLANFFSEEKDKIHLSNPLKPIRKNKSMIFSKSWLEIVELKNRKNV